MAAATRRLHLPRDFRRDGSALLEQQCWLWGQDVRQGSGNLLLAHGFDRARPPHELVGASAYQLRLLPDEICARERAITLWGFGIWYGESDERGDIGSIFIGRGNFEPRWSARLLPPQNVWSPAPIEAATRAPQLKSERRVARALLCGALEWIADYETWALVRHGYAERIRHLEAWQSGRRVPVAPDELAGAWRSLGHRLQKN